MTLNQITKAAELLNQGKMAVFATDTLYGVHARALDKKAVNNVYKLRQRDLHKPFIILISDIADIKTFGIILSEDIKSFLKKYWPNKLSVVIPCPNEKFEYLHRGTKTLAFRLPQKKDLIDLIKQTGPLISTSVNPQGLPPATSITQAKEYFGNNIDLYIDEGKVDSPASTVIKIDGDKVEVLRQGEVKID